MPSSSGSSESGIENLNRNRIHGKGGKKASDQASLKSSKKSEGGQEEEVKVFCQFLCGAERGVTLCPIANDGSLLKFGSSNRHARCNVCWNVFRNEYAHRHGVHELIKTLPVNKQVHAKFLKKRRKHIGTRTGAGRTRVGTSDGVKKVKLKSKRTHQTELIGEPDLFYTDSQYEDGPGKLLDKRKRSKLKHKRTRINGEKGWTIPSSSKRGPRQVLQRSIDATVESKEMDLGSHSSEAELLAEKYEKNIALSEC